jgi:hypothetical protein
LVEIDTVDLSAAFRAVVTENPDGQVFVTGSA